MTFIEKPFVHAQLAEIVARALDYRRLVLENRVLRAAAGQSDDHGDSGCSAAPTR